MKRVILAAIAGTSFSGCAGTTLQGYEGPARPDESTALVTTEPRTRNASSTTIRIISIDGDPTPVRARSVRLLPRDTCLGVRARSSSLAYTSGELCFEASAGRRYELRAQIEVDEVAYQNLGGQFGQQDVARILIVDLATNEILAVTNP